MSEQVPSPVHYRYSDEDETAISLSGIRYADKIAVDGAIEALQDNPKIRSLDLHDVNMSSAWLAQVITAAGNCPNLEQIDLCGNPLPGEPMKALAEALPQWNHLQLLSVEKCALDVDDGKILCEGLQAKPKFATLNLNDNTLLHNDIVPHVTALMDASPRLREVFMSNIGLTDNALPPLANAISRHGGIVDCELLYCNLSDEAKETFAHTLISQRNINLIEKPIDCELLNDYCKNNNDIVRGLITELKDVDVESPDLTHIPSHVLAAMYERLPAMDVRTAPPALVDAVREHIASLPSVHPETVTHAQLLAADSRNYTPLDHPQTWQQIEAILPALAQQGTPLTQEDMLQPNRQGDSFIQAGLAVQPEQVLPVLNAAGIRISMGSLLDEGGALTPLFAQMIKQDTASLLFTKDNTQDSKLEDLRSAYEALPEAQQGQIRNYHRLQASLRQQNQTGITR